MRGFPLTTWTTVLQLDEAHAASPGHGISGRGQTSGPTFSAPPQQPDLDGAEQMIDCPAIFNELPLHKPFSTILDILQHSPTNTHNCQSR